MPGRPAPGVRPCLVERARGAKAALGERVFVLGHHYQRDEVIQFADVTGDSLQAGPRRRGPARRPSTSSSAASTSWPSRPTSSPRPHQTVILPDLAAGCSMADMADSTQVEDAWDALTDAGVADGRRAGHLHELHGRHQGVLRRARRRRLHLVQRPGRARVGLRQKATKVLFFPDQHLGRNTAVRELGIPLERLRRLGPAPSRRRRSRREQLQRAR